MTLLEPLRDLLALAMPAVCASCGGEGGAVCEACLVEIGRSRWSDGPRAASPTPCPEGLPRTVSAAPFEGPLARLLPAYKDDGRRDVLPVLGLLLGEAIAVALGSPAAQGLLTAGGPVLVVPAPSSAASRRRRGDAPLEAVVGAALVGFLPSEVRAVAALRLRRRVADQAGLTAAGRAANLAHAMEVRASWREGVDGAVCLVADDVLTTGATLVEARRALLHDGAREVLAATVCATVRRSSRRAVGPARTACRNA